MADGFGKDQKISHQEFTTFKSNLETINTQLNSNVRHLQTLIGMVSSGWRGAGASAFVKTQNSINNSHDAMNALLRGILEAAHTTQKLGSGNDQAILDDMMKIDVNGDAAGGHLDPNSKLGGINAGLEGGTTSNYGSDFGSKIQNL